MRSRIALHACSIIYSGVAVPLSRKSNTATASVFSTLFRSVRPHHYFRGNS